MSSSSSSRGPDPVVERSGSTASEDDETTDSSENAAWFVSDDPLPSTMNSDDPRRMKLTAEERDWALDIKDMINMMPELESISDFWCAQLALTCKDNILDAFHKARALQHFKKEYRISDSLEDGCQNLRRLVHLFPEHFLSFSFSHQDSMYVNFVDMAKCDPSTQITTRRDEVHWFAGSYYVMHALFPDFESVRKGCITVAECEGVGFEQKGAIKAMLQMSQELFSCYPFRGKVLNYHTGAFYHIIATMMKKVLPTEVAEHFEVGYDFEYRLNEIYMVPTVEQANQRLLQRMEESLRTRFVNEQSFFL